MACDLQKRSRQRLSCSAANGGIVPALLLLLLDCSQETMGDIALRAGLDQRVTVTLNLLQLGDATLKTKKNFRSFFTDVGQLPIREKGHVGNEDLAVVLQRQKGRSWSALTVSSAFVVSRTDWASWRCGTCRRTSSGRALRSIKWHGLLGRMSRRIDRCKIDLSVGRLTGLEGLSALCPPAVGDCWIQVWFRRVSRALGSRHGQSWP
ncbi:MAG: Uncharacterised protein [Synechococcus sp. MIT S9220]|nr:MAG: Uncharacterised protein [Synechococcus sp. MIT S9220]